MRYTICPCIRSDDDAWLTLRRALFPQLADSLLRAEMERLVAQPARHAPFLVIDEEGVPVGLAEVSLRVDPLPGSLGTPVGFLEAIYVAPHARRHGIARALVTHARAWGRAQGCQAFASGALLDNADGLALHRALSFEEPAHIACPCPRSTG